jgi:hypothetical protein
VGRWRDMERGVRGTPARRAAALPGRLPRCTVLWPAPSPRTDRRDVPRAVVAAPRSPAQRGGSTPGHRRPAPTRRSGSRCAQDDGLGRALTCRRPDGSQVAACGWGATTATRPCCVRARAAFRPQLRRTRGGRFRDDRPLTPSHPTAPVDPTGVQRCVARPHRAGAARTGRKDHDATTAPPAAAAPTAAPATAHLTPYLASGRRAGVYVAAFGRSARRGDREAGRLRTGHVEVGARRLGAVAGRRVPEIGIGRRR